jgi:uncharacterized protein
MNPALIDRVEALYEQAKSGEWENVWLALAGERELASACSRHAKRSSGWTFLHQAAHADSEAAVRVFVRLGASLEARSNDNESPCDVAENRGHGSLAALLRHAAASAVSLWEPRSEPERLPCSCAWQESTERTAWRELCVGYGGGTVIIPEGSRYFVDSFERTLVGWHGSFNPPRGMDGEPMV